MPNLRPFPRQTLRISHCILPDHGQILKDECSVTYPVELLTQFVISANDKRLTVNYVQYPSNLLR